MKKVVGVITARKNSKRVPDKNMKLVWNEPLISHTFRSALNAKQISRIILSTDDVRIINHAKNFPGIEVPFIRPSEIAEDYSTDLEVFNHVMDFFNSQNFSPDLLVHLRPTSPLRTSSQIDSAIELMLRTPDATSLRSVRRVDDSIFKMYFLRKKYLEFVDLPDLSNARDMPNQILPETYAHIGYVDIVKPSTILDLKSMTGDRILPYIIENGLPGINSINDFGFYEGLK